MTWQVGFSDLSDRLKQLEKQGDPLARLAEVVDFEMFRAQVGRLWENPGRKSAAGRKPKDPVLMFEGADVEGAGDSGALQPLG